MDLGNRRCSTQSIRLLALAAVALLVPANMFGASFPIGLNFSSSTLSDLAIVAKAGVNPAYVTFTDRAGQDHSSVLTNVITGGTTAEYAGLKLELQDGGGFNIGTVTTSGTTETASLTNRGASTLTIIDPGNGATIVLGLQMVDIATQNTSGNLNTSADANLTLISTSGAGTLAGFNLLRSGFLLTPPVYSYYTVALSFLAGNDLNGMVANGLNSLSYSSTLFVAPEPGFYGSLAVGFAGLITFVNRRRKTAVK